MNSEKLYLASLKTGAVVYVAGCLPIQYAAGVDKKQTLGFCGCVIRCIGICIATVRSTVQYAKA